MKLNQENKPVAQKQHWLYMYAALTLLFTIIGGLKTLHTALPLQKNPYIAPGDEHLIVYQGLVFGIALQLALMIYLVTAKNIKHILLLLKILLVLEVLGIATILFKPNVYSLLVSFVQAGLTIAMIQLLQSIKRSDKRQSKEPRGAATPESKGSKIKRRSIKVIRILFRINSVYYGLTLVWVAFLALHVEHDPLTVVRLFIPLVILGALYLTPYYLLRNKLRVAYIGTLILVTAFTVLSLHIPVHVDRYAPDNLPLPRHVGLLSFMIWATFRASPAFILYGVLIIFDVTVGWSKTLAQRSEKKRAGVILIWIAIFIGSFVLGSATGHHPATHQSVNNIPKQELHVFSFPKYKFQIGFPNKPSVTDDTEKAASGNIPIPYTQYDSYVPIDTIQDRIYRVYAYNWPEEDGTFTGLDQSVLTDTLKDFANYHIETLQAKLISAKAVHIFSGKKVAIEAKYALPQHYSSDITGYVRVFANGNYEYDIEATNISHEEFEAFANTFKVMGPVIPDENVTSQATDQSANGSSSGIPTGQPNNYNIIVH